jgi:hypothetical protein
MVLLISLVLAVLPLVGIAWIVVYGSVTTVDGLFMSLILLAIAGVFGGNALYELRKPKSKSASGITSGLPVPGKLHPVSNAAQLSHCGKVEKVEFFEANVGQTNKSIVTFVGETPTQLLVFEGDLRNALPAGHKVEITFRKAGSFNILTNVTTA